MKSQNQVGGYYWDSFSRWILPEHLHRHLADPKYTNQEIFPESYRKTYLLNRIPFFLYPCIPKAQHIKLHQAKAVHQIFLAPHELDEIHLQNQGIFVLPAFSFLTFPLAFQAKHIS